MTYVDGFVFIVHKDKLDAYKKMAALGRDVWMKYGALDYKECVIDDPKVHEGGLSFPQLTQAKEDELVCFSYIVYKSKEHRDEVNAKVMQDPSMAEGPKDMPFEMNKMAYGGFEVVVDAKK